MNELLTFDPTVASAALIAATLVTAAHALAHNVAGQNALFDAAGVGAAGITVFFSTATATHIVLTLAGVGA